MKSLHRKLLRELWQIRVQALAISMIISCGVASFVMSLSVLHSLELTRSTYYERFQFADVFARLKRAPSSLRSRIGEIQGVQQVETRIVQDVSLDLPEMVEPVVGRLISIPDNGKSELNRLYLRQGRYPDPKRSEEVLANEAFFDAHHMKLELDNRLTAIINGKRKSLRIVGVALTPEYIYAIREGDFFLPDHRRFGVFWMNEENLAAAFDMDGAFNDISITLRRDANEREVLDRLDELTERYGGIGAHGRDEQLSHRYISDELKQLQSMAFVTPSIFLTVAAFILHIVLSRLIQTQRETIGVLKAFGYTQTEIGFHYLKLALLIVGLGVVIGTLLGSWFAVQISRMYAEFFHFPILVFRTPLSVVVFTTTVSVIVAMVGVLRVVRAAAKIPPAEAMKAEPPTAYRSTILDTLGWSQYFNVVTRMIVRQLQRRPVKAILSTFGIALSIGVLILGTFVEDAIDYIVAFEFNRTQRQDVSVVFYESTPEAVLFDLKNMPGVNSVEPMRAVPCRLRNEHFQERLGITGIIPNSQLFRLIDRSERIIPLPDEGLVLSTKLAEILSLRLGDSATVDVLEGERPTRSVTVTGLIADYSGLSAYMNLRALNRMMREGPTISGAFLSVDQTKQDTLMAELKETPVVAGVTIKKIAEDSFLETIGENLLMLRMVNMIFSCIIAFGIVYNTSRISLAERSRELATMRIIGFTQREVSMILLGDLIIITLVALPLGCLFGYLFASGTVYSLDTETHRIPLIINPSTYGYAAGVILLACVISALIVQRRLGNLDLIAVLKTKE